MTEPTAKPVTLDVLNSGLPPYVPPPTPQNVLAAMPDVISSEDLLAAGFSAAEVHRMMSDVEAPAQAQNQAPAAEQAPAVPQTPAAPAVQQPAALETVAAPPPAAQPIVATASTAIVIPVAPDLTAMQSQVAAEEAKRVAAQAKYDEGEITLAEFNAAASTIDQSIGALKAQAQIAQANYESQLQAIKALWEPAVTAYQAANPHLVADQAAFDQWDAALKSVTSNMAYRGMTADQMIRVAHAQLAAAHKARTGQDLDPPGKAAAAPAQPAATQQAQAQPQPGPRTDPRPPAPVTLAGYTAAEANAPDGSRFGGIWALIEAGNAIAAENALAALSPLEREAFLAGA